MGVFLRASCRDFGKLCAHRRLAPSPSSNKAASTLAASRRTQAAVKTTEIAVGQKELSGGRQPTIRERFCNCGVTGLANQR